MLYWALVFLVVAIIAGLFGFGGIASASAGIAQILFFVFLVLLVVSLIAYAPRPPPAGTLTGIQAGTCRSFDRFYDASLTPTVEMPRPKWRSFFIGCLLELDIGTKVSVKRATRSYSDAAEHLGDCRPVHAAGCLWRQQAGPRSERCRHRRRAGGAAGAVTGTSTLGGAVLGGAAGAATGVLTDEDDIDLGKPVWRR